MGITSKLTWFISNAVYIGLLIAGVVYGVAGAMNLVWFFTVLVMIVAIAMYHNDALIQAMAKAGTFTKVPVWIDSLVDLAALAIMVWYAHWVLAVVYFIHMAFLGAYREKLKKYVPKES